MSQTAVASGTSASPRASVPGIDTGHLGQTLRRVYEGSVDVQPIPDTQVELLLRLRHKERERRRAD